MTLVGVVTALPQTETPPPTDVLKPCSDKGISNCCKVSDSKFEDCTPLPAEAGNTTEFWAGCAPSLKIPSCCAQKVPANMLQGLFNAVLGAKPGDAECTLAPET
ncbi:uncharacterized protein MAM_07223 [Metarhizium album ARSEF 1941]|uniref:Hydrophobin n=1 Tax=Metarhizium album (strain ARSEF 1941) TaxID=1081103 RepID=A0A0B2WG73_METAS|nr:uncharacterized protein MAM_07223 [Metarhizium album ARSEF 1941]KHN94996.1 hypothetical protein MAM_07223 [Metarhizium album ARSEF 1941]